MWSKPEKKKKFFVTEAYYAFQRNFLFDNTIKLRTVEKSSKCAFHKSRNFHRLDRCIYLEAHSGHCRISQHPDFT